MDPSDLCAQPCLARRMVVYPGTALGGFNRSSLVCAFVCWFFASPFPFYLDFFPGRAIAIFSGILCRSKYAHPGHGISWCHPLGGLVGCIRMAFGLGICIWYGNNHARIDRVYPVDVTDQKNFP